MIISKLILTHISINNFPFKYMQVSANIIKTEKRLKKFNMSKFIRFVLVVVTLTSAQPFVSAQENKNVEVIPRLSVFEISEKCSNLKVGEVVFFQKPDFPPQASGTNSKETVHITINIDEFGTFLEIEKVQGKSPFLEQGIKAAPKVKFTPTICDGRQISVKVVMTYIFSSKRITQEFFVPQNIKDFVDLDQNSQFYEPILFLTEEYKVSFGFADKKFHENAILTRGEFAQFLRLTLDYLSEKAKNSNKDPNKLKLFRPYNPNNIMSIEEIKDLDKNTPSAESVRELINVYKIVLVNEKFELQTYSNISQKEIIEIWKEIFGLEAVPIHFGKTSNGEFITRGEFALFLYESLRVLSYKVLP